QGAGRPFINGHLTLHCARSLGACSTAIWCPLYPPDTAKTQIVGRDLCTMSRSCDH
ncbi:unnamed protein product, partial [Staurois parvus]